MHWQVRCVEIQGSRSSRTPLPLIFCSTRPVFGQTTNPYVSTGDGVALALRAGADVADLEFVQFHPTVLWLGPLARGQQPLVSEAIRGEGAVLLDTRGERFMVGEHPLAELAPRDVVAKAIMRRMREQESEHVWLDARGLGTDLLVQRFPTIIESCRQRGIDPVTDLIPVAPAQHYVSGGVRPPPPRPAPTSMAARQSQVCMPVVKSHAPVCMAPTALPRTRCSKDWCSVVGSCRPLPTTTFQFASRWVSKGRRHCSRTGSGATFSRS